MPEAMPCCDDNVLALVQSSFEEMHLDSPRPVRPTYVEDEDGVTVLGVSEVDTEVDAEDDTADELPEQAFEDGPRISSAVDPDELKGLLIRPSKKRPRKNWT
jgi:hypothetical protein